MNTYGLADIDGVLHVTCRSRMQSEPTYLINHWPTTARTLDFLRFYEMERSQLGQCKVLESRGGQSGDYRYEPTDRFPPGCGLNLVSGGATRSVMTLTEPIPKPRTSKECEYRAGRWFKYLAKGWVEA